MFGTLTELLDTLSHKQRPLELQIHIQHSTLIMSWMGHLTGKLIGMNLVAVVLTKVK